MSQTVHELLLQLPCAKDGNQNQQLLFSRISGGRLEQDKSNSAGLVQCGICGIISLRNSLTTHVIRLKGKIHMGVKIGLPWSRDDLWGKNK